MSYTITNGICTLADVKSELRSTTTDQDDRISLAIDAASRLIETVTETQWHQDAGVSARKYVTTNPWLVEVDAFDTTTGLIVQADYAGDGSFSTTWQSTDYQLEPLNQIEYGKHRAYTKIRAIRSLYFPTWANLGWAREYQQALVQVTARWGWETVPTDVYQAAVIQSVAVFKAGDAPFGATAFGETGVLRLRETLHPMAVLLLSDYMNDELLVL